MQKTYATNLDLPRTDVALLLLRIGVSALMLTHGIPKLLMLFSAGEISFADPFGFGPGITLALAVLAEFICSILVILGLGTRLAVVPLIITMMVAFFAVHGEDPFGRKELPLLYFTIYTCLLFTGAGKYALDYYWLSRKSKRGS